MHELGVVFYIIKDVKKVAEENKVEHVKSVTLNLGQVSTVVPYMLKDCWKWAITKEQPLLTDCALKIHTIPAITFCENCKGEYNTKQYGKTCPHCGSTNTFLKQGNEVEIKEIEID